MLRYAGESRERPGSGLPISCARETPFTRAAWDYPHDGVSTVRERERVRLPGHMILASNGGFRGFGWVKLILLEIWWTVRPEGHQSSSSIRTMNPWLHLRHRYCGAYQAQAGDNNVPDEALPETRTGAYCSPVHRTGAPHP